MATCRTCVSLRQSSLMKGLTKFTSQNQEYHTKSSTVMPRIVLKPTTVSKAKYGGRHMVSLLPGSGVGPELMGYVREVFRYAAVPVDFEEICFESASEGDEDLQMAIHSIKRNGVALKGNIETDNLRPDRISSNVALRNALDLYVSVFHCHSYPGVEGCKQKDVNIFVIRQNTEGEYSMLEHEAGNPGVIEAMKVVTHRNALRLANYAFEFARQNGRMKVCIVHKANIMKLADGYFLEVCREVAKAYPEIELHDMIVDNCCMQLVSNPHQFDVILTTNLYGSIVSNVICGMIGGAGLLSGCNYGEEHAIFEPGTRSSDLSLVGMNIANPICMVNASIDLLRHLRLTPYSKLLQSAVNQVVNVDRIHTPDLGGQATSTDVMNRIIDYIRENQRNRFSTTPTFTTPTIE